MLRKDATTSLLQEGLLNNTDSPFAKEIVHEREAIERGRADRRRKADKAIDKGRAATLAPVQSFSRAWHSDVADSLKMLRKSDPKEPDRRLMVLMARSLKPDVLAQIILTNLLSQIVKRPTGVAVQHIGKHIGQDIEAQLKGRVVGKALREIAKNHECPCKKCWMGPPNGYRGVCEKLKRMRGVRRLLGTQETNRVLRIARQKPETIPEELAWLERRMFTTAGIGFVEWAKNVVTIEGRDLHKKKVNLRAFNIDAVCVDGKDVRKITPIHTLIGRIHEAVDKWTMRRPHYPPSLTPPPAWADPEAGGYILIRKGFIANGTRAQYAELESANLSRVFDGCDATGQVAWQETPKVAETFHAITQNRVKGLLAGRYDKAGRWVSGVDGIPPADNPPEIRHPLLKSGRFTEPDEIGTFYRTDEGKAWKASEDGRKWVYSASRHYDEIEQLSSIRQLFSLQIDEMQRHARYERFHFGHHVDFRGRAQPMMLYFSHHGPDFIRGVLRFANPEVPGSDSDHWLRVNAANHFGNGWDKKPFKERAGFADEYKTLIDDTVRDPLKCLEWLKADNPFQFLSACLSLRDPEHAKRTPVWQDASANGLQHFAAAGRDPLGAALVNLVDGPTRSNAYRVVAQEGRKILASCADETNEYLVERLMVDMDEDIIKQPVLSTPYNVSDQGMRDQMIGKLRKKGWRDDDAYAGARILAQMVAKTMRVVSPGAMGILDWIKECTRLIVKPCENHPQGRTLRFTSPSGLPVRQPYHNEARVRVHIDGHSYSLSRSDETMPVNVTRQVNGSSPNIVHSWDAANAADVAVRCRAMGVEVPTIFDCFGSHAGNVATTRRTFLESFVAMHERDLLGDLANQWRSLYPDVSIPDPPARGRFDLNHVLRSTYALS